MDKTNKIERFTLEDGRKAERHISTNESGEKVIEIFVEEQRPLKLEKRITEKRKEILAEQKVETIQNGEIVDVQSSSVDPHVKMQLREHIAKADNAELHSCGYVSKKELGPVVADAVVAGISALLEKNDTVKEHSFKATAPVVKAQNIVEERVEQQKKNDLITYIVLGVIVIVQVAVFGFLWYYM